MIGSKMLINKTQRFQVLKKVVWKFFLNTKIKHIDLIYLFPNHHRNLFEKVKTDIRLMKEELSGLERTKQPKERSLSQLKANLEAMMATKEGLESELHQDLMATLSVQVLHGLVYSLWNVYWKGNNCFLLLSLLFICLFSFTLGPTWSWSVEWWHQKIDSGEQRGLYTAHEAWGWQKQAGELVDK